MDIFIPQKKKQERKKSLKPDVRQIMSSAEAFNVQL